MNTPDLINGCFEFAGAFAGALNIWTLYKHKRVRGFAPLAYAYFTVWGLWYLIYYPCLHQWFSLCGAAAITLSNGIYVAQAVYYNRKEKHGKQNCTSFRRKGSGQPG